MSAQGSQTYSFGDILVANLTERNVQTSAFDPQAAAIDILGLLSDGVVGVAAGFAKGAGLPIGEVAVNVNGALVDVGANVVGGAHTASSSSSFNGVETAIATVAGIGAAAVLGAAGSPVIVSVAGGYVATKFAQSVYDYLSQTQSGSPIQTDAADQIAGVLNGVNDAAQFAANLITNMINDASSVLSQIGNAIDNLGSALDSVRDLANILSNILSSTPTSLSDAASSIGGALQNLGQSIGDAATGGLGDLGGALGAGLSNFGNFLGFGGDVNPFAHFEPLVLNLLGTSNLTSSAFADAAFDYFGSGFRQTTGWASPGQGILVYDPNGSAITNGKQLFGTTTTLHDGSLALDGFQALAQYDANGDGIINANDPAWSSLKVWVNSDGSAGSGQLLTLDQAGVQSINLNKTASEVTDAAGNQILATGSFTWATCRRLQSSGLVLANGADFCSD